MQSTDVQSVFASPLQNRDARWQRKNDKKKAMAERGELVSPARRRTSAAPSPSPPPDHLRCPQASAMKRVGHRERRASARGGHRRGARQRVVSGKG